MGAMYSTSAKEYKGWDGWVLTELWPHKIDFYSCFKDMPNSCRFKVNDRGLKPKTIYINRYCIANPEVEQWTARLFIKLPTSYPTSYPYDIIRVADRQYVEQWMADSLDSRTTATSITRRSSPGPRLSLALIAAVSWTSDWWRPHWHIYSSLQSRPTAILVLYNQLFRQPSS